MRGVFSIDKKTLPVTTAPGITRGGAGLGSYESGYFHENVISARGVLPTGGIKTFTGKDLQLISKVEGTTGLISEVTFKIMPDEEMDVVSLACSDAFDIQQHMETMAKNDLPIWSFMFINPRRAHDPLPNLKKMV